MRAPGRALSQNNFRECSRVSEARAGGAECVRNQGAQQVGEICRPGSMVRSGINRVNSFDGSGLAVGFERLRRSGAANALKLSGPDATVHFDNEKVDSAPFLTHEKPAS